MKVTLGGDRLHAGKKQEIELHGFGRSTHDLSRIRRTTMSAGTLVPMMSEVILPDDTWDIDIQLDVKTLPTVGPLYGSYQIAVDIFKAPLRLYQARLTYDELYVGLAMSGVKLPLIEMESTDTAIVSETTYDLDNAQINPSSVMAYLGLRGVGRSPGSQQLRYFNAIPLLMYWDIYKNYYANKQEKIGAVIHTPAQANVTTVDSVKANGNIIPNGSGATPYLLNALTLLEINYTGAPPKGVMFVTENAGVLPFEEIAINILDNGIGQITGYFNNYQYGNISVLYWRYRNSLDSWGLPEVTTFPLENIDNMRKKIMRHPDNSAFIISPTSETPYKWIPQINNGIPNLKSSQEGLGLKTYKSDLFNNWLDTESIEGAGGINEITAVSTAGDSFQIPTLILARKVYEMLTRVQASGGSYQDWVAVNWSEQRIQRVTTPMFMGGIRQEIVFQEVISNTQQTSDETGTQPLGTLAGRGILAQGRKGGSVVIKEDEPSWLLAIAHITPRIDYSQGNHWNLHLKTLDDLHKPSLDQIGFQDLITEQLAWWDTTYNAGTNEWEQHSAGKQPAWTNYMTAVNETLGNFAMKYNQMQMTLNRRYEFEAGTIKDLTTYIDPTKFNFIFAQTSLDSQNFQVQVGFKITARRKMSAKVMPML